MERLGGADPFPRGSDLDQHAFFGNSAFLIQADQLARLLNGRRRIEGQPRIHLGRNPARHDLQNFLTENGQQVVDDVADQFRARQIRPFALDHRLVEQWRVFRLRDCLEDERRIRCSVLRGKLPDAFKVAGVSDHSGELLELVELIHGMSLTEINERNEARFGNNPGILFVSYDIFS